MYKATNILSPKGDFLLTMNQVLISIVTFLLPHSLISLIRFENYRLINI